jgi:hypothetical protein
MGDLTRELVEVIGARMVSHFGHFFSGQGLLLLLAGLSGE